MQESEASFVFKATCMAHSIALLLFNNNRNKLHSKLSVLESSRRHSPSYLWKNVLPAAQKIGDR